jgi:hypothetical protein
MAIGIRSESDSNRAQNISEIALLSILYLSDYIERRTVEENHLKTM